MHVMAEGTEKPNFYFRFITEYIIATLPGKKNSARRMVLVAKSIIMK
jgi:hypothetical protein